MSAIDPTIRNSLRQNKIRIKKSYTRELIKKQESIDRAPTGAISSDFTVEKSRGTIGKAKVSSITTPIKLSESRTNHFPQKQRN